MFLPLPLHLLVTNKQMRTGEIGTKEHEKKRINLK